MKSIKKILYVNKIFIFNKPIIILGIISFFLFALKWTLSFYHFPDEDITMRIINDSYEESYMYFHYIKSFADFNFNNIYNTLSSEADLKIIPFGAIFFHAIFFKIFGISSYIFLEFLSIYCFLFIFYLIFKELKFNLEHSVFLSLIFYLLPLIASGTNYFEIAEINTFISHFYNLRFPRPLIANLFFFYFIYLLIKFNSEKSLNIKTLVGLGIVLGLSFSSFYFLFFAEIIAVFMVFLIKIKKNIFLINKVNFLKLFYSIFIFIVLISPFLYFLLNGSEPYSERMGAFKIDITDKKFFLEHYFSQLFNIKLLMIYIFLIITFISIKRLYKKDFFNVNIFFIIFISSILAPLLFIGISNRISFLYHFNNIVVICTVLLFLIIFLILLKNNLNLSHFVSKAYIFVFLFLVLTIYNIYSFTNFNKKIHENYRFEKNELFKILTKKNIDLKSLSLLTFDTKIMTWAILNDFKNINVLDGTFSPRSHELTDISLIESFKFLNLKVLDFENFIENKKKGYRYLNTDARTIYWLKYQANSSVTFKNSHDFDKQTLEHILTSSPYYSHQFAIPNFEKNRLLKMFSKYTDKKLKNPDLIILDNKHYILGNSKIDLSKYCPIYNKESINAYLKKSFC